MIEGNMIYISVLDFIWFMYVRFHLLYQLVGGFELKNTYYVRSRSPRQAA